MCAALTRACLSASVRKFLATKMASDDDQLVHRRWITLKIKEIEHGIIQDI